MMSYLYVIQLDTHNVELRRGAAVHGPVILDQELPNTFLELSNKH
jgi:hypothetical protein